MVGPKPAWSRMCNIKREGTSALSVGGEGGASSSGVSKGLVGGEVKSQPTGFFQRKGVRDSPLDISQDHLSRGDTGGLGVR